MRSFALLMLTWSLAALPQQQPVGTAERKPTAEEFAATPISLDGVEMPLVKFLSVLEAKVPAEKRLAIRLDENGLGKDLAKVAGTNVQLPRLRNLSLATALRLALKQVDRQVELEVAYLPTGLLITRPRLAAYTASYPIADVVEAWPSLYPELERTENVPGQAGDGATELVRLLAKVVTLEPWETVQVLNGARLVVHATPTRQREVESLLQAMRRLADLGVYMNARLYEVDQAWYAKHVAPLLAKDGGQAVVAIDGTLLKKITPHKVILESESVKLRPNQPAGFLSMESQYRYATGVGGIETGLAGVTFTVRPLVSPDRRFLRLHIEQKVRELVRIDKVKRLDPATGKDVEVEVPSIRPATITGRVDLPDSNPLLMAVDHRPKEEGKVWLLVARPMIWIEEEVKELRQAGQAITPQSAWQLEVSEPDPPPPPLPLNDDVKAVLQAVITDVLTNPDLTIIRESYGTAKDKTLALMPSEKIGWPRDFHPALHGYQLVVPNPFDHPRPVLGIRIDRFGLKEKEADVAPIEIQVGGCSVSYLPKRKGDRWIVEVSRVH